MIVVIIVVYPSLCINYVSNIFFLFCWFFSKRVLVWFQLWVAKIFIRLHQLLFNIITWRLFAINKPYINYTIYIWEFQVIKICLGFRNVCDICIDRGLIQNVLVQTEKMLTLKPNPIKYIQILIPKFKMFNDRSFIYITFYIYL